MTLNRPRSRSQNFRIRYLEYLERYNVRHNGGQLGNHQWAFDWHRDLWPWMKNPSFRSLEFHVKYFKNGDRYNNGVNRSQIGNHPWSIHRHHDLWPWMNCSTLCLRKVPTFKLSVTVSNLNWFSKFLHCWKAYEICYKSYMTQPTSP